MELPGRASPSSITSPSRAYFQGNYEKALEITERVNTWESGKLEF
jgi:hypothetical protein